MIEPEEMYRLNRVRELSGLSKSGIYLQMKNGNFPKPVRVSPGSVAWTKSSLLDWQRRVQEKGATRK